MLAAGCKVLLVIRILHHFGLSRPCSIPVQIVAHRQQHGCLILTGVLKLTELSLDSTFTPPRERAFYQLCQQVATVMNDHLRWALLHTVRFSCCGWAKSSMQEQARMVIPRLHADFEDFGLFHRLAR